MGERGSFWVAGMPEELAAEIGSLDAPGRQAALRGWVRIGASGRRQYADFIASAGAAWVRSLRVRLTARRLIEAGGPGG